MKHRKEIDGLRAIAVLPVIFFHAGLPGFRGGYIGVDIFFVISGYLITSIILEEKNKGEFSIADFYERRARRILPALGVVLLFTTIAAFLLLPADLLKTYSQSLVSVATFSSNIFFYFTGGYFSTAVDEKPLLHTWSLAIEEQYYLFFPVLVVMLWRLGKKRVALLLLALSATSLLFSQYLISIQATNANFYLIFSRIWELLFGSIIAFLPLGKWPIRNFNRELLSIFGLLLIIYSVVFFDSHTPFPSFYSLIPVLGTCLVIGFCNSDTRTSQLLSQKLLVSIGLISYSLYLWHQPIFAFIRLKHVGEPSHWMFAGAVALAFSLAFLSWKYVEKPFRNKKHLSQLSIFKYSITSLAIFLAVGLAGHSYNGFEHRFDISSQIASTKFSPKRKECHTKGHDYLAPENACTYWTERITWASFGDSHTVELAYALSKELEKSGLGLLHLSFSSCPPSLLFNVRQPGCSSWTKEALAHLENNPSIENVLLGYRHSSYLHGSQLDVYPALPDANPGRNFTNTYKNLSPETSLTIYWKSFSEIISRLLKAGKNVYVVYPVPELPFHISNALTPFSVFNDKAMFNLDKATTADYYYKRHKFIIGKLDSLPYVDDNLHAVKPFEILCDGQYCPAVANGKPLYFDDHHLSISGAALIAGSIARKYKEPTSEKNTHIERQQ